MKIKILIFMLFIFIIFSNNIIKVYSLDKNLNKNTKKIYIFNDSAFLKIHKPIFGYRFVIKGNFDGKSKDEVLTEHYISGIDGKETNKFYDSLDMDSTVDITIEKKPKSFLTCSNPNIDTLRIADNPQLYGLSYLKNIGDLDGDGCDEISFVINWADWSAVNSCHIASYKNNSWVELYRFEIRDWELPDLPDAQNQYYLFGVMGLNATSDLDSNYLQREKELKSFPGFIKKLKNGKVKVKTLNADVEDTSITVDLKKCKQKKIFYNN